MSQVMVVPETEDYEFHVSHENVVWITKKLGIPHLEAREARYLAPLWLNGSGVTRVFHIIRMTDAGESTELELGNSFVLSPPWNDVGQRRRFEYHDLTELGFLEIRPGLLVALSR